MPITPDNCHGVVALGHHVSWVHVFRDLLCLENLPAIELVNTARTLAGQSELIRRDLLRNLVALIYVDQTLLWFVLYFRFRSCLVQIAHFINDTIRDAVICLH